MLTGNFGRVSATVAPFSDMGWIREVQLSFWLPLAGGTIDEAGKFVWDRLVLAVPYIFVDNPMSYAGGREDYGYPKVMGQFTPDTGLGDVVSVNAYGGNFSPGAMAGWFPFLDIAPSADSPGGTTAGIPLAAPPASRLRGVRGPGLRRAGDTRQRGRGGGRCIRRGVRATRRCRRLLPHPSAPALPEAVPRRHQLDGACLQQIVEVPLRDHDDGPGPIRRPSST